MSSQVVKIAMRQTSRMSFMANIINKEEMAEEFLNLELVICRFCGRNVEKWFQKTYLKSCGLY
jgi:hypothetical protein